MGRVIVNPKIRFDSQITFFRTRIRPSKVGELHHLYDRMLGDWGRLRAGLVTDIRELGKYPWCGHSAV